ncbi:MAG: VOC family protein [Planctomycetes bacterium]|nr:VOC family protein [Planctomycetota bacterium]
MKKIFAEGCGHIGLFTGNPAGALNFYTRKLGFREEKEEMVAAEVIRRVFGVDSACKLVKLSWESLSLEIFYPISKRIAKRRDLSAGYNHWGLRVFDREKFCNRLKRKKVPLIKIRRNNHSIYFIKDPDGNRIEIKE